MHATEYSLEPWKPAAHLYRVSCSVAQPNPGGQRFTLPAWIPGSYLIRDFAHQIVAITAECNAAPVAVTKCDNQTWECAPCAGRLTVTCEIYARDESVRAAYLDTRRGFFNGTSVFLRPDGYADAPCNVHIAPPQTPVEGQWQIASTLRPVAVDAAGFGDYQAENYAQLIDHPVAMGEVDLVEFSAGGKPHGIALLGRHDADRERLAQDLARVCDTQVRLFGELPVEGYLFLAQVVGEGYGGLEHRDCSMLQVARNSLPAPGAQTDELPDAYMNLLGLCSHEYFHLWNVKRIQPQAVAESDLTREAYFRDLWAYEGVTSYYDDLALVRARLLSQEGYLKKLASAATRLQQTPGRRRQTLADSSFDAWTKFYRPDENTPNAVVSYYGKGGLLCLCLDLALRLASQGDLSLDVLMQKAWAQYGRPEIPVPDGGLEQLCIELGGDELEDFFSRYVHATDELPLAELLAEFGVGCEQVLSDEKEGATPSAITAQGLRLVANASEVRLQYVLDNSAAQAAGLSPGDVLVAINGLRITSANLPARLKRLAGTGKQDLQFFRGDELLSTHLDIVEPQTDSWRFSLDETAPQRAIRRRESWLSGVV